jgi:chemotaxis protein MotB
MKKVLTLLLALCLLLSLAACGGSETPAKDENNETTGIVFKGSEKENLATLGAPETALDAQSVYSKVTYVPEMFYGDYQLLGSDKAAEAAAAEAEFFTWTKSGKEVEYTRMPFRIQAGPSTIAHKVSYIEGYNWMIVYFMQRDADGDVFLTRDFCAYEIDGNKLILKPLDSFLVDDENNKISYTFTDQVWEYDFAFRGRELTLTSGQSSITLLTCLDAYGEEDYYFAEGYLSPESKAAAGLDYVRFRKDDDEGTLGVEMIDETRIYNAVATLQEDGLFTIALPLEEGTKTYQYVCFCGGRDGFVLTDGTNTYYYNDTYRDRHMLNVNKYLSEEQAAQLEGLSDAQLEAIAEKSANLLEDLAKACQDAGLNVTVNNKSGEIALDATVLFAVDESVISAEGQTFLQKFMGVYTSVVFDAKYENFVSKIMVEGHTDTSGDYDYNKTLSEARAASVKDYCLSADCGVDAAYAGALPAMLEAVGYSYDKPVYNENGDVDMDASRRVSFRFMINLEG